MANTKISESLVLVSQQNGVVVIPEATPLTRLNYFDGKFLRASDLKAEQDYLRQLVRQSNQAGGAGVAYGYDVTLGNGDTLKVGPGLAIDPEGRVLLLQQEKTINIQELIEKSRALQNFLPASKLKREGGFELCELSSGTPSVNPLASSNLFVITISQAEALCGEEDVFGKLCEEACVTSVDRPFVVEGLIVRAIPLALQTQLPNSKAAPMAQIHLRSRVASAYFEDERRRVASLISKAGLELATWCLGADAEGGAGVPIGVVAREGATTIFLDPWIARRERIDAPAKRYWQWRMMMRPWDVFLAQVLQFQCQLHDLFKKIPTPDGDNDPCGGAGAAIKEAAETIAELTKFYEAVTNRFTTLRADFAEELTIKGGLSRLNMVNTRLGAVSQALALAPQDRLLIRGGIVELPSAGYLPVVPGAGLTIDQQVRRMMGEGVDLRFCVVRPDYVAHALEEAQHMERISLLEGLDDAKKKPQVDILVPDGEIIEPQPVTSDAYEAALLLDYPTPNENNRLHLRGAANIEAPETGEIKFFTAARLEVSVPDSSEHFLRSVMTFGAFHSDRPVDELLREHLTAPAAADTERRTISFWYAVTCSENPFSRPSGGRCLLETRQILSIRTPETTLFAIDLLLNGNLTFDPSVTVGLTRRVNGVFSGTALGTIRSGAGQPQEIIVRVSFEVTASLSSPVGAAPNLHLIVKGESRISNQQAAKIDQEGLVSWSGTPRKIMIGMKPSDSGTISYPFDSTFTQNDDVLRATNELHGAAAEALNDIGRAIRDPQFQSRSNALLFPRPPLPSGAPEIRGILDWALFHRRRNKQCQEERPAPSPASRLYQVYHLLVNSLDEVESLRNLLLENQPLPATRLSSVATIEFGGGAPALVTLPEDIRDDWKKVNPGNTIVYGAVGNRDSAASDGESLARARIGRLEDTLSPISKPDPQATDDLLSGVPPSIPTTGVDGVMILFTMNIRADLKIIVAALDRIPPGGRIIYFTQAINAGPEEATNVTVTCEVPANTTFESAEPGEGWTVTAPEVGGAGSAVFSKASMAANEIGDNRITVKNNQNTPDGTVISSKATISSTTSDPDPANNEITVNTTVTTVRTALVLWSGIHGGHVIFGNTPHRNVRFTNNVPDDELGKLINEQPRDLAIFGVLLANETGQFDAGATARINAVITELNVKEYPVNDPLSVRKEKLSQVDYDALIRAEIDPSGADEFIFIEPLVPL